MSRRLTTRLLLGAVVLLLVARYAGGVSWGARAAVGLLIATLVIRWGLASMRPLHSTEKTYEPVDVVEEAGVPVYACQECGTQLVLLRRGSDKPPRHCGEAMTFTVVPDSATVPDYPPEDL
ncbi:MAG TPA: hypothetical protein VF519_02270 [Mycobacteriales bacterium]